MESKYGKYIIAQASPPVPPTEEAKDTPDVMTPALYLDGGVFPGAFYLECNWFWKPTQYSPPPHSHDFDEILSFFGTNPEDPYDLCGEVELWLGDEKHIITKSCAVFIPKGLKHCPMRIRRADRPIFHFSTGPSAGYAR